MDRYAQLVDRIMQASGLPMEDIDRKVEAKRAKLSGLISKEGAAQIVAAELGVILDNQRVNISELIEGMKRARILGKITQVFPVREFNKNGRSGKIGSFSLGDESSNIRVVLWDTNHIALIEQNELAEGDAVEISNAAVRNGELHLSAFSDIKKSNEKIGEVKSSRSFSSGSIKDAHPGSKMSIRAIVLQVFDPKVFDNKQGEKRALVNCVLDDGSETIRALMGIEQLESIGFSKEVVFSPESFIEKKNELMGEEFVFYGTFKTNTYFNKLEFSIERIEQVDVNKLLKELEAV